MGSADPKLGTYGGDPTNNLVDEVRFIIGDRSQSEPLFTRGEIQYCLARRGEDPLLAAEYALLCLRSYMTQFPDESMGPASASNSQIFDNLGKQLAEVRRQIALDGGYMCVGGIYYRDDIRDRCLLKPPSFTTTVLEPIWDRGQPLAGYGRFGLPSWQDPYSQEPYIGD